MKSKIIDLENIICKQKNVIKEFQNKYGSDDKDEEQKKEYERIINNPKILYSVGISKEKQEV